MSKQEQFRFYDVINCFLDDERVAAFAITVKFNTDTTPDQIYKELLSCQYKRWLAYLEDIADNTHHKILRDWCLNKQAFLDTIAGGDWQLGDNLMLEQKGFKLLRSDEVTQ